MFAKNYPNVSFSGLLITHVHLEITIHKITGETPEVRSDIKKQIMLIRLQRRKEEKEGEGKEEKEEKEEEEEAEEK